MDEFVREVIDAFFDTESNDHQWRTCLDSKKLLSRDPEEIFKLFYVAVFWQGISEDTGDRMLGDSASDLGALARDFLRRRPYYLHPRFRKCLLYEDLESSSLRNLDSVRKAFLSSKWCNGKSCKPRKRSGWSWDDYLDSKWGERKSKQCPLLYMRKRLTNPPRMWPKTIGSCILLRNRLQPYQGNLHLLYDEIVRDVGSHNRDRITERMLEELKQVTVLKDEYSKVAELFLVFASHPMYFPVWRGIKGDMLFPVDQNVRFGMKGLLVDFIRKYIRENEKELRQEVGDRLSLEFGIQDVRPEDYMRVFELGLLRSVQLTRSTE